MTQPLDERLEILNSEPRPFERGVKTAGLLALTAAALTAGLPGFLNLVVRLGHNIPQDDLATDYVTGVAWACVLAVGIALWPVPIRDRRALLFIWFVKVLVTLGFMLPYESHYWFLDSYNWFLEPTRPWFVWGGFHLGAGTSNMMALSWLHHHLLPISFHALKISLSMIGLVALYLFYQAGVAFRGYEDRRWLYAVALFPSVLFWSSILGKDPVALLSISLYTYGVVRWHRDRRVRFALVAISGVVLAMFVRAWLGPILLLPVAVLSWRTSTSFMQRAILVVASGVLVIVSFHILALQFKISTLEDILTTTQTLSRAWVVGGSRQQLTWQFTRLPDLLTFAPLGMFTALFRPLPGEVRNFYGLLAGLENLVLLLLASFAIKRTRWRELDEPVVLWALTLVVTWSAVYGFISYQNLGTAVRFKVQILPVVLALLLYYSRRRVSLPPKPAQRQPPGGSRYPFTRS